MGADDHDPEHEHYTRHEHGKEQTADPAVVGTIVWANGTLSHVEGFTVNPSVAIKLNVPYSAAYEYTAHPNTKLKTDEPTLLSPAVPKSRPVSGDDIQTIDIKKWGSGTLNPPVPWKDAPAKGVVTITFTSQASASGPVGEVTGP